VADSDQLRAEVMGEGGTDLKGQFVVELVGDDAADVVGLDQPAELTLHGSRSNLATPIAVSAIP
jgi:hypothetical protein